MASAHHTVTVTYDDLAAVSAGEVVEVRTDKGVVVQFVASGLPRDVPARGDAEQIHLDEAMAGELIHLGHTAWTSQTNRTVFGIHLNRH